MELFPGSRVNLGPTTVVQRLLPRRLRSTVGPWCFADLMGPDDVDGGRGMVVAPHPHTGLQTVTWLLEGEVLHRDSLGSEQLIRPGQLNLMTAGRGISHSEHSAAAGPPVLHGLQLWTALPVDAEHTDPAFEHHADLPTDGSVTVLLGDYAGLRSPATAYSPCVGVQWTLPPSGRLELTLGPAFEHAVLGSDGDLGLDGTAVAAGTLAYLAPGVERAVLTGPAGSRGALLGGAPRTEPLVMFWNFVGSTPELVEQARADWEDRSDRYGTVAGGEPRVPSPPLPPGHLKPRFSPAVTQ